MSFCSACVSGVDNTRTDMSQLFYLSVLRGVGQYQFLSDLTRSEATFSDRLTVVPSSAQRPTSGDPQNGYKSGCRSCIA